MKDQVEAWIGEISPGVRIKLETDLEMDLVSLRYQFRLQDGLSNAYRATNVGFGLTYTLPIVVAALAASPDSLLLIENPEAHLHPQGQSRIGDLLARVASCGVQVVIETHSDHVLNGIRLAVHAGNLRPDEMMLYFFRLDEQDGHSEVISPRIDSDGRIEPWPTGFFDQAEKDLLELL